MADPTLRTIVTTICDPCLHGQGDQCHTPGCALWMHQVDLPIDVSAYTVLDPGRTLAQLRRAIADPGRFTTRRELDTDPPDLEPLYVMQARAALVALGLRAADPAEGTTP